MEAQRIAAVATAMFVLAALWPQSSGAAPARGERPPVANRTVAWSTSSGHLYVLDDGQKAVYRFPLAKDGLPATQPDGVLYPQVASNVYGLAVDKVGHVFVADSDQGVVAEFAAGATGKQQPISILNVGGVSPDYLKIDTADRLYVHYGVNQDIAIFAKGAHGNDAPISVVPPFQNHEFAIDYVIAKSGAVYVLNFVQPVAEYDDPLNSPSQPNRFMWPDRCCGPFSTTLALDEVTDRLYIR